MNQTPAPDWTSPVIIVGAGRSGTTRLAATLGAHPDLYMIGETSFLLPRLWATFFERPAYVRMWRLSKLVHQSRPEWRQMPWFEFDGAIVAGALESLGTALTEIEAAETVRLQRAFGGFFAEAMIPPSLRKPRWGFKEIWAGGGAHPCEWDLYLGAFPAARYIQSIRHPLDYLRSAMATLKRTQVTVDEAVHELTQWVAMVRHARSLGDTGRYLEYRMEDFEAELPRILEALDLSHDPACTAASRFKYLPTTGRSIDVPVAALERVEGLTRICDELRYDLSR